MKTSLKRSSKSLLVSIGLLLSVTTFCSMGVAKDLTSRLGLGFRNSYVFDLPSVAGIYYPTQDMGVFGAIGIDTEKDASKSAFSGGLRRIIFKEENLNFYMGGALSFLSQETTSGTDSGFEIAGLGGAEFFLSGLENLGFSFETGVSVANIRKVRFRTIGDHLFRAGMFFYF